MLDKAVIGIAWKGEGIEPKRVDRGFSEDPQAGIRPLQNRQIVLDDVMSKGETRPVCIVVKGAQPGRQVSATIGAGFACSRTDGGEAADPAGFRIDFEIDRDTLRKQLHHVHCVRQTTCFLMPVA